MNKQKFIPKTPEPRDYLSGYHRRMEKNDWELKNIAREVMKIDPDVEIYFHHDKTRYQNSVIFFKGENINSITFHEVPYHWSGCGIKEHNGGYDTSMPFDINDVLTTFHPVTYIKRCQPNKFFKSKEHYLKWLSYLKKWED